MRKFLMILGILSLVLIPSLIFAAEFRAGQNVNLPSGQKIADNVISAGNQINLRSDIDGDLVVFGNNIVIEGTINGNLIAAGGVIEMRGKVTGDAFLAGGQINIVKGAEIGRSVYLATGGLKIDGKIGKDLYAGVGQVEITGNIGGKSNLNVNQLTITETAVLAGKLTYQSNNQAKINPGAQLLAGQEYKQIKPIKKYSSLANKAIFSLISLLVVAFGLIYLAPNLSQRIADKISKSPGQSILWGLLILLVMPIILMILFGLIIGSGLAMIGVGLYILAIYISRIFVGIWLGKLFFRAGSLYLRAASGLLVLTAISLIPYLGGIINLLVIILGLGAIVLTQKEMWKELKAKKQI